LVCLEVSSWPDGLQRNPVVTAPLYGARAQTQIMKRLCRRALRLSRLAFHLLLGACMVKLVYPLATRKSRMAPRNWWCCQMLRVLGVDLHTAGTLPSGCYLIAANHIAWLDVFAIGAISPCWFVAKEEARCWPFAGWMAAANDTLFLKRASPRAAYRMNAEVRRRLAAQQPVAVFPEGTTTDGTSVRDFYPALFQPAVDIGLRVLPLAISYRDTRASGDRSCLHQRGSALAVAAGGARCPANRGASFSGTSAGTDGAQAARVRARCLPRNPQHTGATNLGRAVGHGVAPAGCAVAAPDRRSGLN
jgi:1-acyl-sn-glycerol-3-phosphate acyltransferase